VRELLAQASSGPAPAPAEPALLHRLAAWFGVPDAAELAPPASAPEPSAAEQRAERRRAALAHVEPGLVARLEQHVVDANRLSRVDVPARTWTHRSSLDHPLMELPADDEWREWDIPRALVKDLADCTPQAKLRDLHRPEKDFVIHLEPAWQGEEWEPPPPDPLAEPRAVVRRSYRVTTPLTPSTRAIQQHAAEVRASRAFPWPEAKRERARKRERELLERLAQEAAQDGTGPLATAAGRAALAAARRGEELP
jgi:hypothetical protein